MRAPEETLAEVFGKMEELTGKTGVADKIFQENQAIVSQKLKELGISEDKADAAFVEAEILKKTKAADAAFFEFLGRPDFSSQAGCQAAVDLARQVKSGPAKGFFIKEEKLKSFLDELKIEYVENPKLVRGLDYYVGTVFEFWDKNDTSCSISLLYAKIVAWALFACVRYLINSS